MKPNIKKLLYGLTNRILIMILIIGILFSIVINQLFTLQIVNGETYNSKTTASVLRTLPVKATRGNIYDRYGRPLAINKVSYSVKIDNSIKVENETLKYLIDILEMNQEKILETIPISKTEPYTFLFNGNEKKEREWKRDVLGFKEDKLSMTAPETMAYLKTYFLVPSGTSKEKAAILLDSYTKEQAADVVSLKYTLFAGRYRKYQPVVVSQNVSEKTVAMIEENKEKLAGIYIDVDSERVYPEGQYFSHILGYTRAIDDKDYSFYKEYGYTTQDIVGKSGIEKAYELALRGVDGEMKVEVDSFGRRISVLNLGLENTKMSPIPGKDIYLTLDRDLQAKAYHILEDKLAEIIVKRLTSNNDKYNRITLRDFFVSVVNTNTVSIKKILDAAPDTVSAEIREYLESKYEKNTAAAVATTEDTEEQTYENELKQVLCDAIMDSKISSAKMLFLLDEQQIITLSDEEKASISKSNAAALTVVLNKLQSKDITPQETGLDPCTGSVVVEDVNTGEVLAAVTYPSYDNNYLVNSFDYEYYSRLLNDPTTPLVNRPFMQRKAPGSVFKMITAIAGLEEGVITPTTHVMDKVIFEDAGKPFAKCNGSHGSVDVSTAIEVSCNYFFYQTAFNMGNINISSRLESIDKLNRYMTDFGLSSVTGVEIEEYEPRMASPSYKEYIMKSLNPDATISQTRWSDGDTIRAAIGQSYNNYTVANMAKYIATLANGGTRYQMHLVGKIKNSDGSTFDETSPKIETKVEMKEENLKAVKKGMLGVTNGARGTVRGIFADYDVLVAGKTGTAQEDLTRKSHVWFVGFAPYEEPKISVAVMIPFGDSPDAPAGRITKDIISEYMGLNKVTDRSSLLDNRLTE